MNKVEQIGNCVKKPEMIQGQNFCKIVLAVNDTYLKKDGTRGVNFFNVLVWNKKAENCVKYLDKGSRIAVVGHLQNKTYTAKDGTQRVSTEIIADEVEFLSRKQEEKTELIEIEDDGTMPF